MPRPALPLAALAVGAVALAARRAEAPVVDPRDLSGRTALVTGAGSGIGRSLALLLGQRGAHVHVVDVDADRARTVAGQVEHAGGSATPHTVDVSDADAVRALSDEVLAAGPLDLLFNNAGIGHAGAVVDTPLEDWRRLVEVNLLGVVNGLHAFVPRLLSQGRPAHVVNTASVAGLVPTPQMVPYSTTKAAVVGLSEALDVELRGTGVRVSALCPGVIDTAIVAASTMRGGWRERQASAVALYSKRGTSPDVVARQALDGVGRGLTVIASPRYQVVPLWLVKRLAPSVGRSVSGLLTGRLAH